MCQRRRRHQQWMQAMPPMSAVAAAGVTVTCSGGGVRAGGVRALRRQYQVASAMTDTRLMTEGCGRGRCAASMWRGGGSSSFFS